jgi:hypothetical protein
MGDRFNPKEYRVFLGDCLSSDARTANLDRHWWYRFLQRTLVLIVRRCDGRELARAAVKKENVTP